LEPDKLVLPIRGAGLAGGALGGKTAPSLGLNPSSRTVFFSEAVGLDGKDGAYRVQTGSATPQTQFSLTQVVRSLNLPVDALSSALVVFARYFFLPLDPALLTKLRREVLPLKTPRESAALAAAAVADKGAALTPEALDAYVSAIDPEARREQKGGRGWNGSEADGFDRRGRPSENSREAGTADRSGQGSVPERFTMDEFRKIGEDIDENDPLLGILNRIPGKDGKRWMVYPFQVSWRGKRFMVSVRVRTGIGAEDARLAVDVAGEDRRWLFVVNRSDEAEGGAETEVSLWPPPETGNREVLEREIREALGFLGGRVILRDGESFLAEWRNDVLSPVNEEV
jgi:hypothetical protein